MRTAVMNPLDFAIIDEIKRGDNPLGHDFEPFAPAVLAGVFDKDRDAFLIPMRVTTNVVYDRLMRQVATRLSPGSVPARIPQTERRTLRPYSHWLAVNHPDLHRRVENIVTLGLKPWEDASAQDYLGYLDAAQKVLDGMMAQV